MKHKTLSYLFALLFVLSGIQANAFVSRENLLFTTQMNGAQMLPAVNTDATGVGTFMLNKKRDSLSVQVSMIGLTPTSAGIYLGKEGEQGTLLMDLSSQISGNTLTMRLNGTMVTSNRARLLNGEWYLVIGTAMHPAGAIRGQIRLATDWNLVTELNGQEVVPAVATSAFGLGSFTLSMDKNNLGFKLICKGLSGPIVGVKLHKGGLNQEGPVVQDLSTSIDGNIIVGRFSPNAALVNSLLAGEIYVSVSTAAHPNGEIRSQLRLKNGLSLVAFADGQQMIPVIATEAKAIGVFRLSPTLDTFYYDIVVDGVVSNIDYAHLHVGYAGVVYGALQLDFTSNIAGNRIKGFLKGAAISATSINRLLIRNMTLIIHSAEYPGGEIRGEVVRLAHEGYTTRLNGAQGYGSGYVSVGQDQEKAYFGWVAGGLGSPVLHAEFREGQSGAMLYDLTPTMSVTGTEAAASGVWSKTSNTPFLPENAIQLEQNAVQLYLSTNVDELSGQVLRGMVFFATTSATEAVFAGQNIGLTLAPNPVNADLHIEAKGLPEADFQVSLLNVLGQTVQSTIAAANGGLLEVQMDLSGIEAGVYVLVISDGQNRVTRQLLKG